MWGSLLWYLVQFLPFCISYLQVVSSSSSLNSSFQSGKLCSSEDSFALLHFKNTISINASASSHCNNYAVSYPKTHSWKQGSDCCSWDGVTCDRFTGHVTALDLSSSRLLGTVEVNSSLFLLRNLKKLNLACNDFQGSRMSSKFGQFTYLTHLNLSSSSFSGLVPVEISQLSKLVSFDLSNNTLKLEQPNFVKFLQNITEVRDLVLDFVDMSLVAPGSLVNLSSSLISLSLRHNYLQGEFPNEVLHLPFLQKLILSENIGLTGAFPVSNWSSPLSLFNLSFTSFSGKLPDTIGNLLYLNVLDLAFCNFEGPVPASFWNLTQITSLVLTSNHFTGQISASLSNLVRLTDLYLRHNMFSGQFPDVFRNLRKVKYLDLSQNNFSGQLPLSAFNLTQLSSLDFSDNQLVGQFPSQVSGLSYLTKLRLFSNLLNGTIPPWLFTLPSLEILGLGNNSFTGSLDQSQALAGSLKNRWSDENLVTLLDLVLRTLGWGAICVSLYTQFFNSVLDVVSVISGLFFCYVGFSVKNETGEEDTLLEEPLLDGNSSVFNGVASSISSKGTDSVTPYSDAGLFSIITFSWMVSLITVGNKKTLDLEDVSQLDSDDSVVGAFPILRNKLEEDVGIRTGFCSIPQRKTGVQNEGYLLVSAFFVAKLVECLSMRHWFFRLQQIGIRIRAVLIVMIYNKGLTLSCQAKQGHTSGEMINVMTVDAERIGDFSWYLHDPRMILLQVVLALLILYKNLGLASIATLFVTIIVMLTNFPLGRLQEKFRDKLMEFKDKRMKETSEILRNMRILKLQGWEMKFLSKIIELRKIETRWRKSSCGGALVPFILLAQIIFQILQIGRNYWMAWATPVSKDATPAVGGSTLIFVYVMLSIGCSICILARTPLLVTAAYKTATLLFNKMHLCIFRAPMSFFDATPSGRLLNRVSEY
ncbi:hypothetical protein EZV62_008921 [Acer yangbiense]|uniref:ABC transmembrane type-1 domain-containing protein n=1 Tax=Acer yangbiense TaxID=1000413 RepID=A0A5C7IGR1_9ROSI|nr:hypothetical protein EZV62_008921 [Acer yangbiense]